MKTHSRSGIRKICKTVSQKDTPKKTITICLGRGSVKGNEILKMVRGILNTEITEYQESLYPSNLYT